MKKVLIKRVKRQQKPIGAKAKFLAGLGVGATLAGFSGGSPKTRQNLKPIVRTQEQGKNSKKEKITKSLKDIFGVKEAKAGWNDGPGDWDEGDLSLSPGSSNYGTSFGLPAEYGAHVGSASEYTAQVLSQDTNSANSALLESLQTNTAGQAIIQGEEAKYDQMVANSTQPTSPGTGSGEAETAEQSGLPGGTEESGTEGSGESGGIPVITDIPSVIADSMQQVNNIPPPAESDLINSLPSSQNSTNLQYLNPFTNLLDVGGEVGGSTVYYNNTTGQFQDITGQHIYSGNYDNQGNFVFSENSSLSVHPPVAYGQNMTWEQIVAENGAPAGSAVINIGGTLYSQAQWESGLVPGEQGPVLPIASNLGNTQNAFEMPNIPQPDPYIPNVQLSSNYQQVVTPYLTEVSVVQNNQNVDTSAPVDLVPFYTGVDENYYEAQETIPVANANVAESGGDSAQNSSSVPAATVVTTNAVPVAPTVASAVATTLNFAPITLSDGTKITTTDGEEYKDPSGNAYFYTGVEGADLMRYNATTGIFTYVNPLSPASLATGSGETQNENSGLPAGTVQTTAGSGEASGTAGTGQSVISMAGNTIQNVQGAIGEGINTGIGAVTGLFQGDNSNKPDNLNLDPSKLKTLRKFAIIGGVSVVAGPLGGAVAGMASNSQTTWDKLVDWATDPKDINRPGTVTWTDPQTKEKFSFSKFDIQNAFMLMQSSGIEP